MIPFLITILPVVAFVLIFGANKLFNSDSWSDIWSTKGGWQGVRSPQAPPKDYSKPNTTYINTGDSSSSNNKSVTIWRKGDDERKKPKPKPITIEEILESIDNIDPFIKANLYDGEMNISRYLSSSYQKELFIRFKPTNRLWSLMNTTHGMIENPRGERVEKPSIEKLMDILNKGPQDMNVEDVHFMMDYDWRNTLRTNMPNRSLRSLKYRCTKKNGKPVFEVWTGLGPSTDNSNRKVILEKIRYGIAKLCSHIESAIVMQEKNGRQNQTIQQEQAIFNQDENGIRDVFLPIADNYPDTYSFKKTVVKVDDINQYMYTVNINIKQHDFDDGIADMFHHLSTVHDRINMVNSDYKVKLKFTDDNFNLKIYFVGKKENNKSWVEVKAENRLYIDTPTNSKCGGISPSQEVKNRIEELSK